MPTSRRFKQLAERLEELRARLLPSQFSPTGQYDAKEHDLARAYLVLAHAEIEAYCEDRGRKVAQQAYHSWKTKGRHTSVLMGLLRFHHAVCREPWVPLEKSSKKVETAVNYYLSTIIANNHGIREGNLAKILYPIGIHPADLDNVWLTIMDSFGSSRGSAAHTAVKTQQPIDPQSEFERITKHVLPGLKRLDKRFTRR